MASGAASANRRAMGVACAAEFRIGLQDVGDPQHVGDELAGNRKRQHQQTGEPTKPEAGR